MIRVLSLFGLLLVSACTDPLKACLDAASRDLAVIDTLIAQTKSNIARGYGVKADADVVIYNVPCQPGDGTVAGSFCDRIQPVTRRKAVGLNIAEERLKLRDLRARHAQLVAKTTAARRECLHRHPRS